MLYDFVHHTGDRLQIMLSGELLNERQVRKMGGIEVKPIGRRSHRTVESRKRATQHVGQEQRNIDRRACGGGHARWFIVQFPESRPIRTDRLELARTMSTDTRLGAVESLRTTIGTTESVIGQMTRLAAQHQAVKLAQGFTDEGIERLQRAEVGRLDPADQAEGLTPRLDQTLEALQNPHDTLN